MVENSIRRLKPLRRARWAIVITFALVLALVEVPAGAASGANDIHTIAGTGVSGDSGDGGQATGANISRPRSVFPTDDGGYIFAEPFTNRVRQVAGDGIISTVAGTGVAGFSGDGGPATQAKINFVHSASPTPDGGFLLADTLNNRIRRVAPDGVITTVAGTGVAGYSGDGGPATAAAINNPRGVVALADGGFLIPDTNNHRVRRVSSAGTIATVAGSGTQGFSGDGGPATSSRLSIPFGAVPTPDGGLLIADMGNQRIRKVLSDGTITTIAGTGIAGYLGDDGPAVAARLNNPHNLVGTPDGGFLIADAANNRVRRVGPDGSIGTVAGNGTQGFGGDGGAATSASLNIPKAVAVTAGGQILIADESNNRIRFVGLATAPVNTSAPSISGVAVVGEVLTASSGGWSGTGPVTSYQWRRCDGGGGGCVDVVGATGSSYVVVSGDVGSRLRVAVTATNASSSSVYSSQVVADGPLSYWRLSESSGPLVDVRGFKDGAYFGGPQRGAPSLVPGDGDAATVLNGTSQYLEVPASASWTPSAFSIELVVQPSALPVNRTIWATQGVFTGWWLSTGSTGSVRMSIGTGTTWVMQDSGVVLEPGVRHHLMVTFDGVRSRLYIDGTLRSTGASVTMQSNNGANVMRFGSPSRNLGQYWPGTLDEASFYPAALSDTRVAAHHSASLGPASAESAATEVVT